jgi:hypothetical protein
LKVVTSELGWRDKARREDFVVRANGKLYRVHRWSAASDSMAGTGILLLDLIIGLFEWGNRSKKGVKSSDWYVEIVDYSRSHLSVHKEAVATRREAEALVLRYVEAMERGNLEPWLSEPGLSTGSLQEI